MAISSKLYIRGEGRPADSKNEQNAKPDNATVSQQSRANLGKFLSVAVQLGLVVLLINQFKIESKVFYEDMALLTFLGFLIHHNLPFRYRLPFFLVLSLGGICMIFGLTGGVWLIGIGLVLIGVCHVPVSLVMRVAALLVIGAGLALFRMHPARAPWPEAILPILGSIFMFRLIVYLYDLRHENAQVSIWQRLSYFFLLPNVCFPLFPVVDYKTFGRTYYNEDPYSIYQKGIQWMLRGAIHLMLYRLIYYHFALSVVNVENVGTLAQFLVSNFLLYLRISGQFHLIVGMLCLFGFNLPATHHLYYLASSFNDFWRRINIYWKDFMMKIFYYPAFFKFRRWGTTTGIVLATIFVFLCTWLLHSYQWFWLRRSFPLHWQDALFWGILGLLVVANSLYETKRGRRRTLGTRSWNFRSSLTLTLRTIGVFLTISILWSLWTSESVSGWLSMWSFVGEENWAQGAALVLALLVGAMAIGMLVQFFLARGWSLRVPGAQPGFRRPVAITGGLLLFLFIIGNPVVYRHFGSAVADMTQSLKENRLSQRDIALLQKGYYEGLLGVDRFNTQLWEVYMKKPNYWQDMWQSDASRLTGRFLRRELVPSVEVPFKGATLRINRWGMRDKDYLKIKPPHTYRIALLGASQVMGAGVENDQTFECLLENQLNWQQAGGQYAQYEILNFAVSGYTALERLRCLETKAFSFQPDAVFYVAHEWDKRKAIRHLAEAVHGGIEIPYDFLKEIVQKAGVNEKTPKVVAQRRLRPFGNEVISWVYRRIAEDCRKRNVIPVWIFQPNLEKIRPEGKAATLIRHANNAGFVVLDLSHIFDRQDISSLWLTEWDHHPNAKGHKLIADRLYDALLREQKELQPEFSSARVGDRVSLSQ